jgi:hypothetical protein
MVRLSLYNKGLFCGDQAILWELEDMEIQPLPPPKEICDRAIWLDDGKTELRGL